MTGEREQPVGPKLTRRAAAESWLSPALCVAILGGWAFALGDSLGARWDQTPAWAVAARVAALTWLWTGLFIVTHDAIHGTAFPASRRVNDAIGRAAAAVYALFPYGPLRRAHRLHHRSPGTDDDPDHHAPNQPGLFRWYGRFVGHYVRWWQIVAMAALFNIAAHLLGVAEPNLVVFWVLPSLLSTLQLFIVGTWLPHRGDHHADHHRARTVDLPPPLSLLACFHFGYHWEHHRWPGLPWWRLPAARSTRRGQAATSRPRLGRLAPGSTTWWTNDSM